MSRDPRRATLDAFAAALGFEASSLTRKGNLRFVHATGRVIFTGSHLRGCRTLANAKAQLRRCAAGRAPERPGGAVR